MFNGVRTVEVAGIGEPAIRQSGDTLSIKADGVTLLLRNAALQRDGNVLRVTLQPVRRD